MDSNCLYLIQIFLFVLILVGVRCVSLRRDVRIYGWYRVLLKEKCHYTYSGFSKHIEKKKIYAYDKYQMWRYIERRREASFI